MSKLVQVCNMNFVVCESNQDTCLCVFLATWAHDACEHVCVCVCVIHICTYMCLKTYMFYVCIYVCVCIYKYNSPTRPSSCPRTLSVAPPFAECTWGKSCPSSWRLGMLERIKASTSNVLPKPISSDNTPPRHFSGTSRRSSPRPGVRVHACMCLYVHVYLGVEHSQIPCLCVHSLWGMHIHVCMYV